MFYRRKIILSMFQLFDGEIDKIRLQKLLFLFTQKQHESVYDFVPYKFGCYSYSVNADMGAMTKKGMVLDGSKSFKKNDTTDYLKSIKKKDLELLLETKELYGKMTANAIIKHTYINFPYWATKSEVAQDILSREQYKKVEKSVPNLEKTVLYTIGYEGISLEAYLNKLVQNDVKVLVDVRRNPLSMKFGFSKSSLKKYCNSLGIEYIHIPEVGIHGSQRKELNTQADYDALFEDYRKENLSKTKESQERILSLLKTHQRIALTCFEANVCQCHRKHLAESIENMKGFEYEVKHV